ncbi:MAG: ankyrin repeat domain-containing protein [Planctomycetota bacterium]
MKRAVKIALILIPVAILVHDAGSERWRTFRPLRLLPNRHLNRLLVKAFEKNDWQQVRRLVRRGADVNANNQEQDTALHYAIRWQGDPRDREDVVKFLVWRGANVNARGYWRCTPLYRAVSWRGDKDSTREIVRFLIQHGADVNAESDGVVPLARAADIGVAELLIEHGARVNGVSINAPTPLTHAVYSGNRDWVMLLLRHGADVNDHKGAALHIAIERRYDDIAILLLDNGADANAQYAQPGTTPLHMAAEKNSKKLVEHLIAAGAEVNRKSHRWTECMTPLHVAASAGRKDIVELLISAGADTSLENAYGWTAYLIAEGCRHEQIAELLRPEEERRFLWEALDRNDTLYARLHIQKCKCVNARNRDGSIPLHWAVDKGDREFATFLIEKGGDVNAEDTQGRTPLDVAKGEEMRVLLRKHGGKTRKELK